MTVFIFMTVLMICGLVRPASVQAHPHVFIDCTVQLRFSAEGLQGFETEWVFDEMASTNFLMDLDVNGDGALTRAEWDSQRDDIAGYLAEHGFYFHIVVNGKTRNVTGVRDFVATYADGVLRYRFFAPFAVPYGARDTQMVMAIFDKSFYSDFYVPLDGVTVEGAKDSAVSIDVDDAPELAYYNGQIVPKAMRMDF